MDENFGGFGGEGGSSSRSTGVTKATSTGGSACNAFEDAISERPVEVRFRNKSTRDIYLPANCSGIDYSLSHLGEPPDQARYPADRSCLQTCDALKTEPRYACGACIPSSYRIPPGGTLVANWDGLGLVQRQMPNSCYAYPDSAPVNCQELVYATPGTYRANVPGYGSCTDCMCEPNGRCVGTASGDPAFPDVATLLVPAAAAVEVVFGVCAFGCAGTPPPAP